jgi:hypothetical protein
MTEEETIQCIPARLFLFGGQSIVEGNEEKPEDRKEVKYSQDVVCNDTKGRYWTANVCHVLKSQNDCLECVTHVWLP